jgi:acyl-CoA thioesterase FadM
VRAKRYLNDKPLVVTGAGDIVQCRRYPEYVERARHDWCGEYISEQDFVVRK